MYGGSGGGGGGSGSSQPKMSSSVGASLKSKRSPEHLTSSLLEDGDHLVDITSSPRTRSLTEGTAAAGGGSGDEVLGGGGRSVDSPSWLPKRLAKKPKKKAAHMQQQQQQQRAQFLADTGRHDTMSRVLDGPDPLVRPGNDFDTSSNDVLEFQKPSAQTDNGDWVVYGRFQPSHRRSVGGFLDNGPAYRNYGLSPSKRSEFRKFPSIDVTGDVERHLTVDLSPRDRPRSYDPSHGADADADVDIGGGGRIRHSDGGPPMHQRPPRPGHGHAKRPSELALQLQAARASAGLDQAGASAGDYSDLDTPRSTDGLTVTVTSAVELDSLPHEAPNDSGGGHNGAYAYSVSESERDTDSDSESALQIGDGPMAKRVGGKGSRANGGGANANDVELERRKPRGRKKNVKFKSNSDSNGGGSGGGAKRFSDSHAELSELIGSVAGRPAGSRRGGSESVGDPRSKEFLRKRFLRQSIDHAEGRTEFGWRHDVSLVVRRLIKRSFLLLVILGVTVGTIAFVMAKLVGFAWDLQGLIITLDWNPWVQFLLTTGLRLVFVLGAISLTYLVAPEAAGSGIPELRAILAGIYIRGYLSTRTLLVKISGLTLALSSGLPLGLEGPFIHIAAGLGYQLQKLEFFAHLDKTQILSAACAGGVAACFGAPIGAVLFSIEVTSSFYRVSNYWTAFLCSIIGASYTYVLTSISPTTLLLFQTQFPEDQEAFTTWELFVFMLIGLVGGAVGACMVRAHTSFVRLRRKYQARVLGANPYVVAIAVTLAFSMVTFPIGEFMLRPTRLAVHDLFSQKQITLSALDEFRCASQNAPETCFNFDWTTHVGAYANLSLFIIVNMVFTLAAVTLNWPCGLFSPFFVVGAAFGRLLGEALDEAYPGPSEVTVAASYAVVGAASLSGGVTRTISAAIIALELTGQIQLLFPCLLAVTIACGVSAQLTSSIYDAILSLKGIPLLPVAPCKVLDSSAQLITAMHVMVTDVPSVTPQPTRAEINHLLSVSSQMYFPVIHDRSQPILMGEVSRSMLVEYLSMLDPAMASRSDEDAGGGGGTLKRSKDVSQSSMSVFNEQFSEGVNQSPFQVIAQMSLSKIYTMFHILRPHAAYVTHMSRLIGIITEDRLIEFEHSNGAFVR